MKFFALLILGAVTVCGAEVKIEAENFPLDDSIKLIDFANASGEKFIRFTQKRVTVSTEANIPEAGNYYVWVRTLSFGGGFRQTTVKIGEDFSFLCGDAPTAKPGSLVWEKADHPVKLAAGKTALSLTPESDFSRVDVVILTTDPKYRPLP